MDELAQRSLVFRNAYTHASWTLPVVMSLFTSLYPFMHGVMDRESGLVLAGGTPTFIDVLKAHGYTTAAFVGGRDYAPKFGHTARCSLVMDSVANVPRGDWKRYGVLGQTVPAAVRWLEGKPSQPFFLLVHGYDTHCPFAVPKADNRFDPDYRGRIDFTRCYWTFERTRPMRMRSPLGQYLPVYILKSKPQAGHDYEALFYPEDVHHMIALYDGEIRQADAKVGSLLDSVRALGLEKNTLVILYSDHGDMFGKHGRFMRGGPLRGTFYDDVLHIPLLIYHPQMAAREVDELVQVIDIAPTLLDMVGCRSPAAFRGKSLLPFLKQNQPINSTVFAGSRFSPSPDNPFFRHSSLIMAARDTRWKLIWERLQLAPGAQDSLELYDLQADPEELTNLQSQRPEILQAYQARIRQWLEQIEAEDILLSK
jgi:arylsulfatase A-like enzyme